MKHLNLSTSINPLNLAQKVICLTAFILSATWGFAQIPASGNLWYKVGDRTIEPVVKEGEWFVGFKDGFGLAQGIAMINESGDFEPVKESQIHRPFNALKVSLKAGKMLSPAQKTKFLSQWMAKPEVLYLREVFLLDGEEILLGNMVMAAPLSVSGSTSAKSFLESQGYKYDVLRFGNLEMYRIVLERGKEIFQEIHALQASRLFEFVEPDMIGTGKSDVIPNDPYFGSQWFLNQSNDKDIDAPEAWDITIGLSSVRVAVIDGNGFDLSHTELSGRFFAPYDAVNNNSNPYPENEYSNHGTPCAGLVAARTNNATGVAGVGHNILFVPVRMGYDATSDGSFFTSTSIMVAACSHVTGVSGVAAVSNSYFLGSWATSNSSVRNAFANMRTQSRSGFGAVILASSGNNSSSTVDPAPAGYPLVIAVGASNQNDNQASFSNYGDSLDLVAPGVNTYTVDRTGSYGYDSGNYTYFNGTSAACPIAAAVVGLMASANTSLMGGQLATYLQQSCEKVGGYSYVSTSGRPHGTWNNRMGYGRINARAAVCLAAGPSVCPPPLPPTTGLCSNPISASCGNTYFGSNSTGANNYNSYSQNGTTVFTEMYGPEIFYQITLSQAGSLSINLSGLSADLDLILLSSCSSGSMIAYSGTGGSSSEAINLTSLPAGTYRIVIDGWNYAISNYVLSVNCTPPPPTPTGLCSNPIIASCGNTYYGSNNAGANNYNSYSQNGTTVFTEMYGPEIFYQITLSQAGSLSINLSGLSADLDLILLSSCSSGSMIAYSGTGGSSSEAINLTSLPAGTYRIVIDGWNYAISNYVLSVNCGVVPPPCAAPIPTQLFASIVTTISARLNTHYQGATAYDWRYRITGMSAWNDLSSTTVKYVDLSNLTPYTTYEFQSSAYCGGAWTSWSASQFFGTGFPINNESCGATDLSAGNGCNQIWGSNTAGSTSWNPSLPGGCNTVNMRDIWFKVQIPSTGKVKINTFEGTLKDALVSFYTGNCNGLTPLSPNCYDDNTNGDMMPDVLITSLSPGAWLYVRVWGYNGASGSFYICAETVNGLAVGGFEDSEIRAEIDATAKNGMDDKEVPESPQVRIFPVPAQHDVTVSTTLAEECNVSLRIASMAGQLISEEMLELVPAGDFSHNIDVSKFPPGGYLLQFESKEFETTLKFMKF